MIKKRFEAVSNPRGHFEIWDNKNDQPVIHRDRPLSFESEKPAARIAAFLNETAAIDRAEAGGKAESQQETAEAARNDGKK